MNHRYSYCKKDWSILGSGLGPRRGQPELGSPGGGALSDSRTTTPQSQMDSDERESEEEDEEAMCVDDIRVVQVDDGECEIYEGNFDDEEEEETETGQVQVQDFFCDVVEVELGNEHLENRTSEGKHEEKEESAGVVAEKKPDCEAERDKVIREGLDSNELSKEVVTNK
ncbi:hypothetical protein AMECASPLE_010702 [Ameca splendens]|uniref:Uncharacterized protein n=2 Tax=Goodeidae TaxID=28758 RepID=A0ABV0XDP0_9TELE